MKKYFIFIVFGLIFLFDAQQMLYSKVIFINQSGHDLRIYSRYIDNIIALKKNTEVNPLKENYQLLKNKEKISYPLGLFLNKNQESLFVARWYLLDHKGRPSKMQNNMELAQQDFGWRNIIFIIDENGDYHKKMP